MRKVYANADEALAGQIKDGMLLMAGGFGLSGVPETLIEAVRKSGAKNLTNECRRPSIPRSQLRAATLVGVRRHLKRWSIRLTLAT